MTTTNPYIHTYYVDLRNGADIRREKQPLASGDKNADVFLVHLQDGGKVVSLDGAAVTGKVIRADGQTVPLAGSVADGAAKITLDESCYAVPGEIKLTVTVSAGDVVQSVLIVTMDVQTSETGIVVDNGVIGTLSELLAEIENMRIATQEARETVDAANTALDKTAADAQAAIAQAIRDTDAAVTEIREVATHAAPPIVVEADGALVAIGDGAARPVVRLVSSMAAVQSGSGEPSPENVRAIAGWDAVRVWRTGRNLLDASRWSSGTTSGVTLTNNGDGSVTVTGTNTAASVANLSGAIRLTLKPGTYTVSGGGSTAEGCYSVVTYRRAGAVSFAYGCKTFEIDAEQTVTCVIQVGVGATVDVTLWPMIEAGGSASAFEPYQVAELTAALPETVYGGHLDWVTGVLTVTHGHIAAYAGETVPDGWISSVGALTNGSQVVYPLAEPYTIQLAPQTLDMLKGNNTVWSDCGNTAVSYVVDTKTYVDAHAVGGSGGSVASVNGKTGAVVLNAADVGAMPADAQIVDADAREQIAALSEEIVGVEPHVDDLPRIFFGASIPQNKNDAAMKFRYSSRTLDFDGYCETKAQGNSSMAYPKKNQTTKLFEDLACETKHKIDFKGWGKQNKFCLKANWIDLTHARNIVGALVWGDVVRSRAGYESLPELMRTSPNYGAIDGFPVRAFANGVYQGRYTINIPKDKWMANMDDENPNHCILCGENYISGCFRAPALIDGSDWSDEIHDVVPDNIKTRWNQVIDFVMTATDEEFVAGLDAYIDVESAIDYYLFGLAVCNLDGFGKNQLFLTYDGLKWYASVYDMDSTFGLYYDARGFVSAEYARTSYEDYVSGGATGEGNLLYNRLAELFVDRINTRWEELRHGALSANNIINRFEAFVEITPPYIVAEDYAKTTANGKFVNIPLQDTNNIQQIRTYVVDRLAYVNAYLLGEVAEVNLWNLAGRELKKVGVFVSPTAKLEIDRNAYYNGVNRAGYWQDAQDRMPVLVVNGDDFAVTTNQSGNSGYGIGVPIEMSPGSMYRITCDVAGRGMLTLMYYDADGKYISRNELKQPTADGGKVDAVVTIPACDLVVVQAANNATYSEGATNLTTTYSNIRIVKQ